MKFNVTVDKKVEAAIDRKRCINCGECREVCPTHAIEEYQKTVACLFPQSSTSDRQRMPARSFSDAKKMALETVCSTGCPLGVIPQTVTALVKNGDLERAYAHIAERNPLPWVCASICDHMCQDACKRGVFVDAAINMRALEKYVLTKAVPKPLKYIRRFHERIAVIGGGPAGISAAFHLATAGYPVTIFEKDKNLGGALNWGIPAFRLDKQRLKEEIDTIISAGIEVRYEHHIGENYSLGKLWEEGFSACLLAVGTSLGMKPAIEGADGDTVYDGVRVMRQITGGQESGVTLGDRIAVIGGGGFAADIARVIRRMGKDVICAAMDHPDDLQIPDETLQALRDEGIELKTLTAPKQIIKEGSKVKAIEFVKTEYIEDDRGRLTIHPIKGSAFNYFCDTVIFAIGQKCSVENISKVETYPDGTVKIDEKHRTNKNMIFACGDATGESGSAAEALAAGKQAAAEIDAVLQGLRLTETAHRIRHASDGQAVYPDNIQNIRPQFETCIREGQRDNENAPVEDVLSVLRAAGVEENMPTLIPLEAKGHAQYKVAVIGGGIAGITAAISLAKKGHEPTIFEKYPALGGSLRWLATDKRIDQKILTEELKKVEASGIDVVYNVAGGIKPTIDELFKMGFSAVLFAIGEQGAGKPDLKNADCAGVFDMITLMGKLADQEEIPGLGQRVLVAGGDAMTFDIARKLKETCSEVTILAPCSKGSLQVATEAADVALEEGVHLVTGVKLSGINAEDGRVCGADCRVLEKNFPINILCDTLVIAGEKRPETDAIALRNLKLDVDKRGNIVIDAKLAASIPGVFAIRDFNMSSSDVGRAGAVAVDNYLTGADSFIGIITGEDGNPALTHEMIEGNAATEEKGFETGRAVFSDTQAIIEASRCMGCGYHKERSEDCMGCGICVKLCPAKAITLVPVETDREVHHEEIHQEEV